MNTETERVARYVTRTDRDSYTRCVCDGPCQYLDEDAIIVPEDGSAMTVTYCAGINHAAPSRERPFA